MSQQRNALGPRLTARSVLASTLLGTSPPRLPGRVLVRAAELFGISDGTATRRARTWSPRASSTPTTAGGTKGSPGLGSSSRVNRSRRWAARGRTAARGEWGGRWHLAVVVADRRSAADRSELRDELRRARLGELREGVWARPDNVDVAWPASATEQCTMLRAEGIASATSLWDLTAWGATARDLRRRMSPLVGPLERGDTAPLADGFVVSAAVLRLLQADPPSARAAPRSVARRHPARGLRPLRPRLSRGAPRVVLEAIAILQRLPLPREPQAAGRWVLVEAMPRAWRLLLPRQRPGVEEGELAALEATRCG